MDAATILPPSLDQSLAAHFRAAEQLHRQGRLAECAAELKQALRIHPNSPEAHYNLANVVRDAGELELALEGYKTAISLAKDKRHVYPDAMINLADVQNRLGRYELALAGLRDVLRLQPNRPEAHIGMANAHEGKGMLAAAIAALEKAAALLPQDPGLPTRIGILLHWYGRQEQALDAYGRALAIAPDFAEAHFERAKTLLALGRFQEGFTEHEWRTRITAARVARLLPEVVQQAEWDGKTSLKGRTIIAYGEPGYAETIQFLRYLPLLAEKGARVVVLVPEPLRELALGAPGVSAALAPGGKLPLHDDVVGMMRLPGLLGKSDAMPGMVPYLGANKQIVAQWKKSLKANKGFRIGVAWIGPSIPVQGPQLQLAQLASLASYPGVTLVALQQTKPDETAEGVLMPGLLPDFAQAAGLIEALDLVITVDTAVAHLAAAMGKHAWVLLPTMPAWVWGIKGETTEWYPTAKLFRQKRKGNWDEVMRGVGKALSSLTKTTVSS